MMTTSSKRKIFFRADADSVIGYGHFMRTLALAEIVSKAYDCVFATMSPSEFQKDCLRDVCKLVELPSDPSRFDIFVEFVEIGDIVVLDNYFYDSEYENRLRKKGAIVVLIDNLHTRHSSADVIIGFSIGLKVEDYSVEPYTKLYLGPSYSLLRRPFVDQIKKKHPPVVDCKNLKVVVSFGGADRKGIALSIAKILESSPNIIQITLVGNYSERYPLHDCSKIKYRSCLTAHEMRDVFILNDVAILPASITTLEAIACGIVVIGGFFVDNQISNYHQYLDSRAIIGCGNFNEIANQFKVKEIIESKSHWAAASSQSFLPVDLEKNILSIFEAL